MGARVEARQESSAARPLGQGAAGPCWTRPATRDQEGEGEMEVWWDVTMTLYNAFSLHEH